MVPDIKYDSFYLYDELTGFIKACADAEPELVAVRSLCTTVEGRELWLATITDPATGPAESKPAYYVQACVHSHEKYGTTAALHFLRTLLTVPEARAKLADMTFYIVPRVNPDGAEYAITTGGENRSRNVTLDVRNGLVPQDLNGDGLISNIRIEDPAGPLTEDPEDPRILVPRRPGDTGPFYRQITEGLINDYDGGDIRSGVKFYDFNRNYPANWSFSTDQSDYPFAQPEMRAIGDFLLAHHNIFAGIDFHGGTPAILRPCTKPDAQMNQSDLGLVLEIANMGSAITGFNVMNARDYRASWRQPSVLSGNSNDFAYFMLGISWYVIEVGWGYSTAGLGPDVTFDAWPEQREREFMRQIMKYHDEQGDKDSRVLFVPWQDYDHPQLGKVQIGGMMRSATADVFPPQMLEISSNTTDFLMRHADLRPSIELSGIEATNIAGRVYRIRGRVANTGYLATNVMSTGLAARTAEPVTVELPGIAADAVASIPRVHEFAGLAGRGADARFEWFITAEPGTEITVTASHPRGGIASATLKLQ